MYVEHTCPTKKKDNYDNRSDGYWKCQCGQFNTGKFCSECGKPMPVIVEENAILGSADVGKQK